MTRDELRKKVLQSLQQIAPEADLSKLKPKAPFRDQLDLDSMDLLNFLVRLHEELGIDIPEREYGKLTTLDACVDYLSAKFAAPTLGG
jgi:acyl carrier protein